MASKWTPLKPGWYNFVPPHKPTIMLKRFLDSMALVIPIEWDRSTEATEKDYIQYYVYGWIKRTDNRRDFVLLGMKIKAGQLYCNMFVTSSAKYSREIMKHIYGNDEGHTDCVKVENLPE